MRASYVVIPLALTAVVLVASTLERPVVSTFPLTEVEPREAGDALLGPITVTVDASDPERWSYFDFSRGAVVPPDAGLGWDIAFTRSNGIVNGGEGFAGEGGVIDLGEVPFDSVSTLPTEGYEGSFAGRDSTHAVLSDWYDYSFTSHLLTARPRVYAIRTADGRYAKLRFLSFYCPGPTPGCVTFEYVYQGEGGRVVARP